MEPADIDSIPLFAGLSDEDRARVAGAAHPAHFESGHEIVREGEFSFDFYAIRDGAAAVRRHGEHVADLGPGDVFGEMGVLPSAGTWSRRRGATVVATAPTEALYIEGGEFRRLAESIPALAEALRALVAERTA